MKQTRGAADVRVVVLVQRQTPHAMPAGDHAAVAVPIDEDQRVRGLILAADLDPQNIDATLPEVLEHHRSGGVAADPNDDANGQSQSRRGGGDIPFDTPWPRLPVEDHDPVSRSGSTVTRWMWSMTALPTVTRSSGPVDIWLLLQSELGGGAPGLLHEAADQVGVLATAVGRGVRPGERVDSRWPHMANRVGDIVRAQAAGQDDRNRWRRQTPRCGR